MTDDEIETLDRYEGHETTDLGADLSDLVGALHKDE